MGKNKLIVHACVLKFLMKWIMTFTGVVIVLDRVELMVKMLKRFEIVKREVKLKTRKIREKKH